MNNEIKTRFFNCKQGDKVIIKDRFLREQFITSLVKDIEQNSLRPLLFFTKDYDYYPCESLRLQKEPLYLFQILEYEKDKADVFIIDSLDENLDIDNTLRLIQETTGLKDKTIFFFCDISHLSNKVNDFKPNETQIENEKNFKTICKSRGIIAIYELHFYSRFGCAVITLVNSENKEDRLRLSSLSDKRELIPKKNNDKLKKAMESEEAKQTQGFNLNDPKEQWRFEEDGKPMSYDEYIADMKRRGFKV